MTTASNLTAVIEDAWLADHHSGVQTIIGREGSLHGLSEYLELKYCLVGGD